MDSDASTFRLAETSIARACSILARAASRLASAVAAMALSLSYSWRETAPALNRRSVRAISAPAEGDSAPPIAPPPPHPPPLRGAPGGAREQIAPHRPPARPRRRQHRLRLADSRGQLHVV